MTDEQGEAIGPWRRLTSDVVYENPWIRVHHETVLTPAGTPGIYGRVHFRNQAIGIVAIDADEHVFLVKQFRYTRGEYSLEIPKGAFAAVMGRMEIIERRAARYEPRGSYRRAKRHDSSNGMKILRSLAAPFLNGGG